MAMTEKEFLNSIDTTFPYDDITRGRELALAALKISPNAAFGLVEELARPPIRIDAPIQARLVILNIIREGLHHPIAPQILGLAERMILNEFVSVTEVVAAMEVVAQHPGEYGALNIAYFSCDDQDNEVDALYRRIVAMWETV